MQKTVKALPDKIGRQELGDALKENWFASFNLRMSITGRRILPPEPVNGEAS